ncbi:hypothetical protein BLNAU_13159 [Blattamonas nauphoetae]|uniref:Uncharacterized protein n=1 Tax=Blattamonas nauphoetae TaxID=2049346 RepID=A0ABQ9XHK0_9EUKA|nr:hypothetical protein BLNAU_13159 [Blattamonas nauphoetae]
MNPTLLQPSFFTEHLIGRPYTSDSVQSLIHDLGEPDVKIYKGGDSYYSWKSHGLSFFVKGSTNRIESVFLYNESIDGFSRYLGKLPHSLTFDATNQDVVRKLGEPDDKGGPPYMGVWIAYESLGIQLDFKNKSWDDKDNPIAFVTLFQPS